MDLLTLAARHRGWLASRQAVVAENVANANTPGYRARQVQPFAEMLSATAAHTDMSMTHARHLGAGRVVSAVRMEPDNDASAVTHSGNSVEIERELMTASAVRREYRLNNSISLAYQRMIAASTRG